MRFHHSDLFPDLRKAAPFLGVLLCLCFCLFPGISQAQIQQQVVRACGAIAVALPLSDAIPVFRSERNIELVLRSAGGTGNGLDALGERSVNMALCSREVTSLDRADYPEIQFVEAPLGVQVLAIAVSQDVWKGGVRSLSADQARGIYEGDIKNWKQVGGPDLKIKVFMPEQGRGSWEVFVQWLYGELKKAPIWHGAIVRGIQETRNMLEFTPGSLSLIPPGFVDNQDIYALPIQDDSGRLLEANMTNVLNQNYPLSRPLLLVTDDKPTGPVKVIIDFMVSDRGQALVKQYGYLTLAELKAAKEAR
jgi:phosphate transport system substrate-binding protein